MQALTRSRARAEEDGALTSLADIPPEVLTSYGARPRLHVGESVIGPIYTTRVHPSGRIDYAVPVRLEVRVGPRIGTIRSDNVDPLLIESAVLAIKVYNRCIIDVIRRVAHDDWSPLPRRRARNLMVCGLSDELGYELGDGLSSECFNLEYFHPGATAWWGNHSRTVVAPTLRYTTAFDFSRPSSQQPPVLTVSGLRTIMNEIAAECLRRDRKNVAQAIPLDAGYDPQIRRVGVDASGPNRVQLGNIRVEEVQEYLDEAHTIPNSPSHEVRLDVYVQLPSMLRGVSTRFKLTYPLFDTADRSGQIITNTTDNSGFIFSSTLATASMSDRGLPGLWGGRRSSRSSPAARNISFGAASVVKWVESGDK